MLAARLIPPAPLAQLRPWPASEREKKRMRFSAYAALNSPRFYDVPRVADGFEELRRKRWVSNVNDNEEASHSILLGASLVSYAKQLH